MAQYLAPTTIEETLAALATGRFQVVAGGTDVYPALRDRPLATDTLDLHRLDGLRGIQPSASPDPNALSGPERFPGRSGPGWRIGALATWSDLLQTQLPPAFDGLKAAAREVGGVQIQNAATIVGNLCNASPAADGVPPLLALDAQVEIASLAGRRSLPLQDFITGPRQTALARSEMVTHLFLPARAASARCAFRKLGARRYLVISIAMAAVLLEADAAGRVTHARVAVGACGPVASRLPALEAALLDCPLSATDLAERVRPGHLAPLSPIDDVRAGADYRRHAAAELVRRTLADCAEGVPAAPAEEAG